MGLSGQPIYLSGSYHATLYDVIAPSATTKTHYQILINENFFNYSYKTVYSKHSNEVKRSIDFHSNQYSIWVQQFHRGDTTSFVVGYLTN